MTLLLTRLCGGALLAAGAALATPVAAAPSFDCAAAKLPIEVALCTDPALGDLEGEMTRLFEARLADASAGRAERLRREMRNWLRRLTEDCGVPRSGDFSPEQVAEASPCLARKYRDQIAALQPRDAAAATAPAAEPPPAETPAPVEEAASEPAPAEAAETPAPKPEAAAEAASADTPEPAPQSEPAMEATPAAGPELAAAPAPEPPQPRTADEEAVWRAEPYGDGVVAMIARLGGADGYATASVYCDSQYPEQVPVFLYRLGKPVPPAEEVARLNAAMEGARLIVDGKTIQTVGREDLGTRFSGLQLLPDGTLSYMVLIDPPVLENILAGHRMQAVLQLPEGEGGPFASETFPLRNSRKAIEAAMQRCVTLETPS